MIQRQTKVEGGERLPGSDDAPIPQKVGKFSEAMRRGIHAFIFRHALDPDTLVGVLFCIETKLHTRYFMGAVFISLKFGHGPEPQGRRSDPTCRQGSHLDCGHGCLALAPEE